MRPPLHRAQGADVLTLSQNLLRYRAGPNALRLLRREGLHAASVRAVVGPASGPKWLVLPGIDRALRESGLLRGGRKLLVGASAGAWRIMTFACGDPAAAHRALLDGYVEKVFTRRDTPRTISAAYRQMLTEIFDAETDRLVDHPVFDLAIHTARVRHARSKWGLVGSLAGAVTLDVFSSRALRLFFERVLFHSRPDVFGRSAPGTAFEGRVVALTRSNLVAAARATGAVPVHLEAVRDPSGAPAGSYVDGGLTDYHLNQRYTGAEGGVVLMPHYRRAIVGQWLDKRKRSRTVARDVTADLLQIYPSREFVASLPDGRLPDRQDFRIFIDDPGERIARWHSIATASEALGEELLQDLESGRLADRVQPL